jgi:hypothetical protein
MRSLIAGALFGLALPVLPAAAEDMPVPVDLQAALFKKIFEYDRTLQNRGVVLVAVVGPADSPVSDEVVAAFGAAGIRAERVDPSELEKRLPEVAVVYVTSGLDMKFMASLCERNGLLSISGVPDFVLRGDVAIGVGTKDQKPEILVHLRRVKTEGHDLSAGLLEVAKVIR